MLYLFVAAPRPLSPKRRALAATSVVLAVAAGAAVFVRGGPTPKVAPVVQVAPAPAPASIVVVPLVSIGADSGNAYLADGITNELASALARVPNLQVVSPSRAAAMLAAGKSPSDIGKALNVALQLEGTIQRDGKRLRVTARLVGVNDGVMRWSDTYERQATDLLSVQDDLARAITSAVRGSMGGALAQVADTGPSVAEVSPASGQAYDLYLRGRFQLGRRSPAALQQAIVYFQQAVQKDPGFAPAYSGLADALGLQPLYTSVAAQPALLAALKSADKAISLDSTFRATCFCVFSLNARKTAPMPPSPSNRSTR